MRRFLGALGALFLCGSCFAWAYGASAQTPSSIPLPPAQIQAAINASIQPGVPGGLTAVTLNQILNQFDPFTNIWFDASGAQNGLLNVWNGSAWVPFVVPIANLTTAFASPPCLGCSAPAPVFATSLSATGTVSGAGMSAFVAAQLAAGLPAAVSTLSVSGTASFAGAVSGAGMDTYTAARLVAGLPIAATTLSASGTVSGAGFDAYTALRLAAGLPAQFSTLSATSTTFADRAATFQSFGAAGNGSTDDTAAVQTAMRSGTPLYCRGTFLISSLITVTNTNIDVEGGGDSCQFILANSQSMFSISQTGNILYTVNRVTLKGIRVKIGGTITNVVGPAHTAAFFINYPTGSSGAVSPSVIVDDVRISPTIAPNYILNGLYFNDASQVHVSRFSYEGNRTAVDPLSNGVVFDGTHTPVGLFLDNSHANFAGRLFFAPQENSNGWQGIRIKDVGCASCQSNIVAQGSLDGLSDHIDVTGAGGTVNSFGISVSNASHAFVHQNRAVLSSTINGLTNGLTPTCFQVGWTIAVPANSPSSVADNTCDGTNYVVGGATRYGEIINGVSSTPVGAILGPNTNSNLDVGQTIFPNTAGVTAYAPSSKNVTIPFQNLGTVGGNSIVPPLAVTDGSARAAGSVGEVISSFVPFSSQVALVTGTSKTVTQINLSAGDWDCRGDIAFNPGATTFYNVIEGSVSIVANTPAALGTNGGFFLPTAFSTGVAAAHPIGPFQINIPTTQPLYLIALSNFTTSTMAAYGNLECRRM